MRLSRTTSASAPALAAGRISRASRSRTALWLVLAVVCGLLICLWRFQIFLSRTSSSSTTALPSPQGTTIAADAATSPTTTQRLFGNVIFDPAVRQATAAQLARDSSSAVGGGSSSSSMWDPQRPLKWVATDKYLPLSDAATQGFMQHERKQRQRYESNPDIRRLWGTFNTSDCLRDVPECEFWQHVKAPTAYTKCCVEHTKLKATLFYALDVAESANLQLFLDSGTLLSAFRDGGETLVPWETDIDLGVVGSAPGLVANLFREYERSEAFAERMRRGDKHSFYFEPCVTRTNASDTARFGQCKDAHYVYYASTKQEGKVDTSRTEIWPFADAGTGLLMHPTRKRLSVARTMVLPLVFGGRCRIWGRPCYCPKDSEAYLDNEYVESDWRLPRTIHWGEQNVLPWRGNGS